LEISQRNRRHPRDWGKSRMWGRDLEVEDSSEAWGEVPEEYWRLRTGLTGWKEVPEAGECL
jgi:hypothetical protein